MLHRGRISSPSGLGEIIPLKREDLAILRERRDDPPRLLERLRDPHHNLARLLAMGKRNEEAGRLAGYSANRVAMLKSDPAFKELIEYYRNLVVQSFKENADEYFDLLSANMIKAEKQIAEKLEIAEEAGETLPIRELVAIGRDAADRVGYGKKQTNLNVNVDFASQLEKAIKRSGKDKQLELTASPPSAPARSGEQVASTLPAPQPLRRRA